MDFALGYAAAYLKICALAVAIMAVIWGICRVVEARGRERLRAESDDDG